MKKNQPVNRVGLCTKTNLSYSVHPPSILLGGGLNLLPNFQKEGGGFTGSQFLEGGWLLDNSLKKGAWQFPGLRKGFAKKGVDIPMQTMVAWCYMKFLHLWRGKELFEINFEFK